MNLNIIWATFVVEFILIMFYYAKKFDAWAEGEADKNTRIERDRHDKKMERDLAITWAFYELKDIAKNNMGEK